MYLKYIELSIRIFIDSVSKLFSRESFSGLFVERTEMKTSYSFRKSAFDCGWQETILWIKILNITPGMILSYTHALSKNAEIGQSSHFLVLQNFFWKGELYIHIWGMN